MTDCYLLDTNIVLASLWPGHELNRQAKAYLRRLAQENAVVLIPAMVVAELEFILGKEPDADPSTIAKVRQFLGEYALCSVDLGTVEPYTLVRIELFRVYGNRHPKKKRKYRENTVDKLKDSVRGKDLAIDERDLLIASNAVQHNLVFVTNDKNVGMRRIREAADTLYAAGKPTELRVEHWS